MRNPSEHIADVIARCKARAEDPEYQARAAQLSAEWEAQQAAQRRHFREATFKASRIPESMWDLVECPGVTEAVAAAQEFIAGKSVAKDGRRPRFLMLAGPKGRGKTVALAWCVHQKGGRYFTAQELVAAGSFDVEFIEMLKSVPCLGLDEMGAEKGNDAFDVVLYDVLDARYRRGKLTAIGTNLDGQGFKARYCSGGMDRLLDRIGTSGMWVAVPGESMRGQR